MSDDDATFLARWSRRKALVRDGLAVPEAAAGPAETRTPIVPPPAAGSGMPDATAAPLEAPPHAPQDPPPTLDDVARLTPASDFARFVASDVATDVKNAALKKLFADPHFNVMDGLDTYIDDYSRPDPLPIEMLKKMRGADFLGLLDEPPAKAGPPEPAAAAADSHLTAAAGTRVAAAPPEPPTADENPDLRLQPDDAAGPAGDRTGAGEDPARQP